MGKNIYLVTSPSGNVNEYFEFRKSAIAFIIDEFAMADAFRYEDEGTRLAEYMEMHNETPNQYPYKYNIEEIALCTDYDD